jgi:hypothetical protein
LTRRSRKEGNKQDIAGRACFGKRMREVKEERERTCPAAAFAVYEGEERKGRRRKMSVWKDKEEK